MHRKYSLGTSLVVLWLGLCLSMQEVTCSVPGPTCLVAKKREKKKKRYSLLLLLLWTSSDVSVCPPPVQVEQLPTCLAR